MKKSLAIVLTLILLLGIAGAVLADDNQTLFTISGTFLDRLDTTTIYNDPDKATTVNPSQYRLRLNFAANVSDSFILNARLVTDSPYIQTPGAYGLTPNDNMVNLGNGLYNTTGQIPALEMDRVNAVINIWDGFSTTLGRQSFAAGDNLMIVDANYYSFDGIKLNDNIGGVNSFIEYGRFLNESSPTAGTLSYSWENLVVEGSGKITPDLNVGAGYLYLKNLSWTNQAYTPVIPSDIKADVAGSCTKTFGQYALQNWYLFGTYNFTPNLQLAAEYTINCAAYATSNGNNSAENIFLRYGDLALNKPGQMKYQLFWYQAGANSLGLGNEGANSSTGLTNFDATATTTHYQDFDLGYWYAFTRSLNLELHYVTLIDNDQVSADMGYHYFRAALNFTF